MPSSPEEFPLSIEPLARKHKRAAFSCGNEPLNRYLKTQASQDAKRHVAAPFVLVTTDNRIIGYYTLSAFSIKLPQLPTTQIRKLPQYPTVPATLLGRLAIDQDQRGFGLGEFLLMDALYRSAIASADIASYAVIADAKDDVAIAFYAKYSFVQFPDNPHRLFLPMKIIKKLF